MLQNGASLTMRTQPNMSSAVVAWNASSDECHIVLSKTRRAVFAQLIIFACLAFPAAQFFYLCRKALVQRRTTTVGVMIIILSFIIFCAVL